MRVDERSGGRGRRRVDSQLIAALASGMTVASAADQVGVGEATVYRRLREPEFRDSLAVRQEQALDEAMNRLGAGAVAAVETLLSLLEAENEAFQLGAARALLGTAVRLRDRKAVELEARIAMLEHTARRSP